MTETTIIQLLHLMAPGLALFLLVGSHAALCRICPSGGILSLLLFSAILGGLGLMAMEFVAVGVGQTWESNILSLVLVDGPVYACFAFGYANFVNLGQSSVRIRIYRELLASPQGIPLEELRGRYDEVGMLVTRLQRLREAGDLVFDGSVYRLRKRRLLIVGLILYWTKKVLLGRESEFHK